ncbi:MAG: hypothetical protein N3F63_07895 [Thermoplasmata archaeon]|nr:hypothetical protein [Thermoplasmata archaeon]
MKLIGIATTDIRAYYEILKLLKEKNLPFEVLVPGEQIPMHVGVVITTMEEREAIDFENVVVYDGEPETTVLEAMKILMGKEIIHELVVGIDPGEHIGVAVVGDGVVLGRITVFSADAMVEIIKTYLKVFKAFRKILRVGHGDITKRNKIISVLWKFQIPIEIVNEQGTTTITQEPDVEAAVRIAMHEGKDIASKPRVEPSAGELRNIQRISRIKSNGKITISKKYAREVARGEITIEEAIEKQIKKKK